MTNKWKYTILKRMTISNIIDEPSNSKNIYWVNKTMYKELLKYNNQSTIKSDWSYWLVNIENIKVIPRIKY